METQYSEDVFTCTDELQLFYRCWCPATPPRAAVIIVHGFSDHSGRYATIVQDLVHRTIAVYSFDQRGHGRSPGKRGFIESFTEFRQDLLSFKHIVAAQHADIPLYLMGHSMGGLIVLDFGLHHPDAIDGVIASAPYLNDPPISPILRVLSRALSRIWPSFSLKVGLDSTGLSRLPETVQAYEEDPLVHGKGTPRLDRELSAAVAATNANASRFELPLLIMHGTADRLTDPEASRRFYENASSQDKTFILYEGGYHEGHNDIHRERVVMDIGHWLEEEIRITTQEPENRE